MEPVGVCGSQFTLRMSEDFDARVRLMAGYRKTSVNDVIIAALEEFCSQENLDREYEEKRRKRKK